VTQRPTKEFLERVLHAGGVHRLSPGDRVYLVPPPRIIGFGARVNPDNIGTVVKIEGGLVHVDLDDRSPENTRCVADGIRWASADPERY
jgi:hypothetical protein